MIQSAIDTSIFRLGRRSYIRTSILGWLLLGGFLICALVSAWLGMQLLSGYAHAFTPYLKWQDVLVALCCYITCITLGGCILIVRFLYALRAGYRREMLVVSDAALTVRDLSPENLASIFWLVGTSLSCFIAVLVGLIPEMLIGWTLQLSHPVLAVLATTVAIVLSLAGLAITLPACSFVIIGWIGSVSFCRNMGSLHFYQLTNQANLSIAGFTLTIIYPDAPEALVDLKLLDADDQRHLLHLLHDRWIDAQYVWNPQLGEEIEAALQEAERSAVLI
jgi:hypothetical protein